MTWDVNFLQLLGFIEVVRFLELGSLYDRLH